MKPIISIAAIAAIAATLYAGNGQGPVNRNDTPATGVCEECESSGGGIVAVLPVYALSYEQQSTMEFMYQEEKMARDVYLAFFDRYGVAIFENIAASEQKHMDAIKTLLDKYGIAAPVDESVRGEFADPELQALYEQLIEQGSASLDAALEVGQTIELVDIDDLETAIADANEDAKIVYERLMLGSENHLAAFTRLLEGETGSHRARRR